MASHVSTCMEHGMSIKWDGDQFVEGERNKKERKEKGNGKEEKKEKRQRRRRKGERERGKKGSRHFDGRNSSDQEVKSVYSMRTTLQEVGILSTLIYFPP